MVQKTLRTMQDDIKEARERLKKPAFGLVNKKEELPEKAKTTNDNTELDTFTQKIEKRNPAIVPEEIIAQKMPNVKISPTEISENTEKEITEIIPTIDKKPEPEKIIIEKSKEEVANTQRTDEIKPINFEAVLKSTNEIQKDNFNNEVKTQDKELEDLTQRISNSMNQNIPIIKNTENIEQTDKIDVVDRDKELKELIGRMSQNLQETNEELQDLNEKLSESEVAIEKLQKQEMEVSEIKNKPEKEQEIGQEKDEETNYIMPKSESNKEIEKLESASEQVKKEEDGIKETFEQPAPPKEKTGEEKASAETPYWSKLHNVLKSKEEKVKIKPEVIKEEEDKTQEGGIITPKQIENIDETEEDAQTEDGTPKTKIPNFYDNYINPENRLVFGKQEYYSSIHKKIKPKIKKENLEQFKDTFKNTEQLNLMTDAEEKMKLRRRIAKKYGINLDALPWKKIIIGSVVFLTVWGAAFMYIAKKVQPPATEEIIALEGKSIGAIDEKISQEVTATQSQVSGINYFDAVLDPWKDFPDTETIRLRIIQNNKDTLLAKDDALKTILGEESFNNIPQTFQSLTTEEYNILVFKNNNEIRLGIAFKFDQLKKAEFEEAMLGWERTSAKKQKIYNVMKALFVKTKTTEAEQDYFNSANYKEVNLKYVNIPDTNTSMDYFIVDDIIIFTTSKDTTVAMINFLKQ